MSKTNCFNPRSIQLKDIIINDDGSYLTRVNVPCGKCENCIKRRRMEWCFRMEEELKVSKTAYFVTLTYSPERVQWDKYGNMVLEQKELVKFFKRLRINTERSDDITWENLYNGVNNKKDKIKYYACGEYGQDFGRPHYHAIIYNASKKHIKDAWYNGYCHIKPANAAAIAYCTKYMDKWRNKKQDWKKPKEFNIQSKGLGESFVKKVKEFYKINLDVNYTINSRGIKIPLSRYYNMKILDDETRKKKTSIIHEAVENERKKSIEKLGVTAYNDRELSKQRYIKKIFKSETKKREM